MKKITSLLAAAVLACMSLTSCSSLSTSVTNLVTSLLGLGSDDSDITGTDSSKHMLFVMMNMSDDDICWFVPRNGRISNEMTEETADYIHTLAAGDVDPYYIKDDSSDPIWTYKVNDAMPIYVFKASTLEQNDWKTVVDNEMWETVKKFTADDIIEASKLLCYPF